MVDPPLRGAVDSAGSDQRRNQNPRHAHAKTGEVEAKFADRAVPRRHRVGRWCYVVVAPSMLVIGNYEQCRSPVLAVAERVINVVDQLLARRDIIVRMLAIAGGVPARLQEGKSRQCAFARKLLEIAEVPEMTFVGALRVGVIETGE